MIIKVCGMRDPENISDLSELDINYMGFIFYPLSPRFLGKPDPKNFRIPDRIKKTGVFVNEELDGVVDMVMKYHLNAVQLHGNESPDYCVSLRKMLYNFNTENPVQIIKAIGVDSEVDFNSLFEFEDFIDYFLFDTRSINYGGTGKSFDWELLNHYNGLTPYFLSGGLSAADLDELRNFSHPKLMGYDFNSKFEISPGLKDIALLKETITKIRGLAIS